MHFRQRQSTSHQVKYVFVCHRYWDGRWRERGRCSSYHHHSSRRRAQPPSPPRPPTTTTHSAAKKMALCCARGFSHPRLSLFVQVVSCSVTAPQTMHGLSDSEAEWHYRGLVGTPAQPWWARHSSGTAGQLRPPYSRASVQARPNLPIHFGQEPPINPISGKKHRLTSDPDHPMVRNSV